MIDFLRLFNRELQFYPIVICSVVGKDNVALASLKLQDPL